MESHETPGPLDDGARMPRLPLIEADAPLGGEIKPSWLPSRSPQVSS
jgi:hypothetical protein